MDRSHLVFPVLLLILAIVLIIGYINQSTALAAMENLARPLQYVSIVLESIIAITGLFLAIRKKKFFGYGIFLTFAIYVFYDSAKLIPIEVPTALLNPVFFVATLSILWAVILIYKEK